MEQTKLKRFKRIINKEIIATLIVLMFLFGGLYFTTCGAASSNQPINDDTVKIENTQSSISNIAQNVYSINIKDSIKNELVKEVNKYIRKQAPKSHHFIPSYIVNAGLAHNIDICFIMAQTQIETNFGTLGAGREVSRRSMFGVAIKRYNNYEAAINDYCNILKRHYLGKGRTEHHLMAKYVTHKGARYASNPKYEKELASAYHNIKSKNNIYNLQQQYMKIINI